MAQATVGHRLLRNISLVGPPGSGKGSYGRLLSARLNMPLITVSDVLREANTTRNNNNVNEINDDNHHHNTHDGSLLDDAHVSDVLLQHLKKTFPPSSPNQQFFFLDGFPRTVPQIHIMEETWPLEYQIHGVLSLQVPDDVCERKLLGRRLCTLCGQNYNVHGVSLGGFELPPTLPSHVVSVTMSSSFSTTTTTTNTHCCNDPHRLWMTRPDDSSPRIVQKRLQIYHEQTKPVLDHYQEQVLKFVPFRGYDEVPAMADALLESFSDRENSSIAC